MSASPPLRARSDAQQVRIQEGVVMADKSPKKSTSKTSAAKSLKEKRVEKKDKAAAKKKAG